VIATTTGDPIGPPIAATDIALGAYVSINGQFVNGNPSLIDWYASLVGRMPAIVSFGGDLVHSTSFDTGTMDAIRARGAIPMYTMDPANDAIEGIQPAYSDARVLAGAYDQYFRLWAQAAAAWGHPLLLRFAPEFNGWWFSWGTAPGDGTHNTPAQFVAMWRHVHDIFTASGATNVQWVWCANTDDPGTTPYALDYPGDNYVDWVAMDGYNWGAYPYHTWKPLDTVFGPSYNEITALADKPVMIAETGSVELGGDKAAWITDGFLTTIPQDFPRIRAVVVFESINEHDWRVDSSPASLAAFKAVVASPLYGGSVP
jgi:beta-mannanase